MTIDFALCLLGITIFVLNWSFWAFRVHNQIDAHNWATGIMQLLALVMIAIGLHRSVKASVGGTSTIEVGAAQASHLDTAVTLIKGGDCDAAADELKAFKKSLVQSSDFPGIASGIVDQMSFAELADLKSGIKNHQFSNKLDTGAHLPASRMEKAPNQTAP